MNVHKRCQKNVANNCGINTKEMAEILNAIGVNTKINQRKKKVCHEHKMGVAFLFFNLIYSFHARLPSSNPLEAAVARL